MSSILSTQFELVEKKTQLSSRETECTYYLLKGLSAKEIAKILGLSYRTVELHLINIRKKLNCNKTSTLILKLINLGYLEKTVSN